MKNNTEMINNNITELVFILDRSGSMGGLESDVIGGFNSMIRKQREEAGEAFVTTILFDDRVETVHSSEPIGTIPDMDRNTYYVRGCTALLDAVGSTILSVSNRQDKLEADKKAGKVIFVITTDGLENASRRYQFKDVKKMIERQKKKYNWEFLFLGANIDAIEGAGHMGISADRAANYHCDETGTALNYQVLEQAVSNVRKTSSKGFHAALAGGAWKARIDEDYADRKS